MESQKENEASTVEDLARAEFRKRRNRLGILTSEQESAIEFLLISTVMKISYHIDQAKRLIRPPA